MIDILFIKNIEIYNFSEINSHDYLIKVYYHLNDKGFFHHDTLPSVIIITFYKSEVQRDEYYFEEGTLFKKGSPAMIQTNHLMSEIATEESLIFSYHEDKTLVKSTFFPLGKELLDEIKKYPNVSFYFVMNTYPFRHFGPSEIHQNSNSSLFLYHKKDRLHREDGPAYISKDNSGAILKEEWYLEGELIIMDKKHD